MFSCRWFWRVRMTKWLWLEQESLCMKHWLQQSSWEKVGLFSFLSCNTEKKINTSQPNCSPFVLVNMNYTVQTASQAPVSWHSPTCSCQACLMEEVLVGLAAVVAMKIVKQIRSLELLICDSALWAEAWGHCVRSRSGTWYSTIGCKQVGARSQTTACHLCARGHLALGWAHCWPGFLWMQQLWTSVGGAQSCGNAQVTDISQQW